MSILRISNILCAICLVLAITFIALSCTSSAKTVNTDRDGFAIKGFDPVAYFTMGKPVKGLTKLSFQWNGAAWLFSSKEHLDLFSAAPEKFAPQYGGY